MQRQQEESNAGATAVAVLATEDFYYVANAGDSRASLCRGGVTIELTQDHSPDLKSEIDRIALVYTYIHKLYQQLDLDLSRLTSYLLGDHLGGFIAAKMQPYLNQNKDQ